jgi:hypothetical protein
MVSASSAISTPLAEGYYTATNMSSGFQIGYDWFAVRDAGDGLMIESKHTLFGTGLPQQCVRFELDADWTPRRLELTAESLFALSASFEESETLITTRDAQGEKQFRFAVGRRQAYFLLSGGLYFPLHLVRRFDFENTQPQTFNMIPEGICEVRRIEDLTEEGRTFRQLEGRMYLAGIDDMVRLVINERDDLVRYHTRNQNLLVKLEERGPSC